MLLDRSAFGAQRLALTSMLCSAASLVCGQTLFFEDWDDGLGSSRWSSPLFALENPELTFDGGVSYSYDYSVLGIGPAPNSSGGTTVGVFMETNTTDAGSVDEGESVGILPLNFDLPAGDFKLTADAYLFWNGLSGSTEFAMIGVHHQDNVSVPMRFDINYGDGVAWQISSDGDSGVSEILQFASLDGAGVQTAVGDYQTIPNGTIPNVPTGFPAAADNGPANQWIELAITRVGGLVSLEINGYTIDTFNTEGFINGGTILLGQSDPFNSVNVDDGNGNSNGVVFDNIRVAVLGPPLAGDYNGDGMVDAADYTVWRDGGPLQNETESLGVVDADDYTAWVNGYGSSNLAIAIPEPSVGVLACLAMLSGLRRRR